MGALAQVVRLWVQRSVYENTSSDVVVAGEEHSKLLRYLEDPVTRDSCYREMVARVLDDKTRDGRVLGKVLALLKKHVPHLPPVGHETLLSLDHFLATHETSKSEGVAQTMQFLRALVQHQLQKSAVLHRQLKSREASRLLPANRSALSASLSSFGAMGVFLDGPQPLLGNLWTLAARDQAVPELGLHTRSFFAMINDADGTELFESTAHQLSINVFASPMADRIAIVADYKMQTGLKAARLQVHLNRKRAPPKGVPYDKQPPLELSDTERRKLLYVVINEDACGRERHMMATKVLIKALMDGFVTQPWETAAKAVLQNIYKMVCVCVCIVCARVLSVRTGGTRRRAHPSARTQPAAQPVHPGQSVHVQQSVQQQERAGRQGQPQHHTRHCQFGYGATKSRRRH